jgi:curved DNA-binding protein CbpA
VWRELRGVTDYFALLQQPRKPWLDPGALKQKYQELTFAAHPDRARANESSSDFAAITEGYRVLSDHKLRLQHLLRLQGDEASSHASVPKEFVELFSQVDMLLRKTSAIMERLSRAQNALSRSLLRPEILSGQQETQTVLGKLDQLREHAVQELRELDETWIKAPEMATAQLVDLYRRFAYLGRWIDQLRESVFRLAH